MRGRTLVVALAGDGPPPLKILVERLVQQLQTRIDDLKFCTNRTKYENRGRCNLQRSAYRVRGADLDEQRRDQQHQQRAPSHHPLSGSHDLLERGVSRKLRPNRMERPREGEEGLGIRRGRCGVADGPDEPKGRRDGGDR
jgi:hypothetical protein